MVRRLTGSGYFLFYYAFAHVTFSLFNRYSGCFADLPYEHQKNVVMCE